MKKQRDTDIREEGPIGQTIPDVIKPAGELVAKTALPPNVQTNLDILSPNGRAMLLNCQNPATLDVGPGGKLAMKVVAIIVHPDTVVDDATGEVTEITRTVLVDKDGKTYKLSSDFAARRARDMMQLYSPEEWARGIQVLVEKRQSKRPDRVYTQLSIVIGDCPSQ